MKKNDDESSEPRNYVPLKMPGVGGITEENVFDNETVDDETNLGMLAGLATTESEEFEGFPGINISADEVSDDIEDDQGNALEMQIENEQ